MTAKQAKGKITVNPDKFYDEYRRKLGKLTQGQVDGINFLISKLEHSAKINHTDTKITLARWAYVLATVMWETANTFRPITEYGSQKYLRSKRYWPFIGRGYVQLTWEGNYIAFGNALGIDLRNHPELANDPETAWLILEEGMTDLTPQDPEFTGKSLEDYFNERGLDYSNARKIINPKDFDSYAPIARMAVKFFDCLNAAV